MQHAIVRVCLLAGLLLFGCGGKAAVDWQERVGVYTIQDAERDYGPVTGTQALSDDSVMYVWYDTGGRKWKNTLALIFDADGKLKKVEKNERN